MTDMTEANATTDRVAQMEALIRKYFDGCNEADAEKMVSCFEPDAVHYFPPWRGARLIADKWVAAVANIGSRWTIDRIVCDARRFEAAIEWSHFQDEAGQTPERR